jgi:sugar-specific transcriptional regulator TrmB
MEYRASPTSKKEETPSEYIISNVRSLVEQQQYFFDMLWSKAIPAKQRIKEIEQGAKREFVETIRDPGEIQKIALDLIKKAEEEILIVFSTANAFRTQKKAGALELLKESAKLHDVKVRILVPMGASNNDNTLSERVQQLKNAGVDIRAIKQTFQNRLTMLIVDQSLCLTVELNDDVTGGEEETYDEAIVLATYSNSEANCL